MTRPVSPLFFLAVFLLVIAAAALMLLQVIGRGSPPLTDDGVVTALVAEQLALLRKGDAPALAATFSEEVRPAVTEEYVRSRQAVYADVTASSLVGAVSVSEAAGVKTAEVRTPQGAPLGRFVCRDGGWLADTLWIR